MDGSRYEELLEQLDDLNLPARGKHDDQRGDWPTTAELLGLPGYIAWAVVRLVKAATESVSMYVIAFPAAESAPCVIRKVALLRPDSQVSEQKDLHAEYETTAPADRLEAFFKTRLRSGWSAGGVSTVHCLLILEACRLCKRAR